MSTPTGSTPAGAGGEQMPSTPPAPPPSQPAQASSQPPQPSQPGQPPPASPSQAAQPLPAPPPNQAAQAQSQSAQAPSQPVVHPQQPPANPLLREPAHQPAPGHQGPHQPPPRAAVTVPLGQMLYLCVAALGVINLFLGYVSAGDGEMNLYKAAVAIYSLAPTMFFLAGLVALRTVLPGDRAPGALPAMITTAIFVTLVLSAISSSGAGDLQTLFIVFGAVQFVLAWLAYLFDCVIGARR